MRPSLLRHFLLPSLGLFLAIVGAIHPLEFFLLLSCFHTRRRRRLRKRRWVGGLRGLSLVPLRLPTPRRETNRRARAGGRTEVPLFRFWPFVLFRTSPLLLCLSTKNFLPSTFASWTFPRSRRCENTMNFPIHSRSQGPRSSPVSILHPCLGYSFYLLTSVVVST